MEDKTADQKDAYPKLTPQELAEEYGVPLSQRLKPDFSKAVVKRHVPREEAKARGLSWFFDASTGACRAGHIAPRRLSNDEICADCERVKKGLEPIYGKSRVQTFYKKSPAASPGAPAASAAPAVASAPELSKKDTDFLTALADTRSFDAACEMTKVSRGAIESRAAANAQFAKSLSEICERLQIPRTLKASKAFIWTSTNRQNLVDNFTNTGLLFSAIESIGASPREYFEHLESNPEFRAAVDEARPLAAETLRERSLHAASTGNIHLLKFLTEAAERESKNNPNNSMSVEQQNAEIRRLLARFDEQGLLSSNSPQIYEHRVTKSRIDLNDYKVALDSSFCALEPVGVDSNDDLVSA